MHHRDTDRSRFAPPEPLEAEASPRTVRFRTRVVHGGDSLRRAWQGVYSYGEGWSCFDIRLDLDRMTLTLRRLAEFDYDPFLRKLAGRPDGSTTPVPPPVARVEARTFDIELIGLKMAKVNAGAIQSGPNGEWLVVQAFLPRSAESFLFGVNDSLQAGEVVVPRPESISAVVHAFSQVFG